MHRPPKNEHTHRNLLPARQKVNPPTERKIGETLLCLIAGNGQADGWQRFNRLLRQIYSGGAL